MKLPLLVLIAFVAWFSSAQQPASSAAAKDRGWPRVFDSAASEVHLFQPQLDEWPDFGRVHFHAALSVTAKTPGAQPVYGVLTASAAANVALEERQVVLSERKIESLEFPDAPAADQERLRGLVLEVMPPAKAQTISLDRLLSNLDVDKLNLRKQEVHVDPPRILCSDRPALLVVFLGKPRFKPIAENDLMVAINTNWDVFLDPASSTYFLRDGESWLSAKDVELGPWTAAAKLPDGLSKLPADANWSDVRSALPGKPLEKTPVVYVSRTPAELVVTEGEPQMEPLAGGHLSRVTNTESELFYLSEPKQYYLLTAGRWFKSDSLGGTWSAASNALPEDFKKLPDDEDDATALAAVPGTAHANEAVILASLPQKASVQRSALSLQVTYDGAPDFRMIHGSAVKYGYNTPFTVFFAQGGYYCCSNAVWFVAPTPTGPWTVCDSVPDAIYALPPDSPGYNSTYVKVYASTPETVETGYSSGYYGATVSSYGVVVFGLGTLYGSQLDDDDVYYGYWPYRYGAWYYSYGCGAAWSAYHGAYVSAVHAYGPYGGAGAVAAYNPATGVYSRGAYAYGPAGAAGYRTAYNPATGNAGYRAGATTPYGSWSRAAVTNGDDWVRGGTKTSARGSAGAVQGSGGGAAVHAEGAWGNGVSAVKQKDGDVYAGADGNVYKKTDSGWQQVTRQSASQRAQAPAERPTQQPAQRTSSEADRYLQQQSSARQRGEYNTQRYQGGAGAASGGGSARSRGGRGRR